MAGEYKQPIGEPPLAPSSVPPTPDERTWGMLAHLSSVIAILLGGLSFLGPLIVWIVKKDQSAFVADQGKEALNFQIAVLLASLVCGVTCILAILIPIILVANIVYSIIAAMEANKGVYYRYPYTLRLIN
jgi:uncharacterized Tic20 family protein